MSSSSSPWIAFLGGLVGGIVAIAAFIGGIEYYERKKPRQFLVCEGEFKCDSCQNPVGRLQPEQHRQGEPVEFESFYHCTDCDIQASPRRREHLERSMRHVPDGEEGQVFFGEEHCLDFCTHCEHARQNHDPGHVFALIETVEQYDRLLSSMFPNEN